MARASKISAGAVLTLALTACGAHSFTGRLGGSTASTATASTARSSPNGPTSQGWNDHGPEAGAALGEARPPTPVAYLSDGRLDKVEQNGALWTVLAGFTIEEATQRARAAGHTRPIKVNHLEVFDPECKADTVCRAEPIRWEIDDSATLYLMVNRKIEISTPE